jgi:tRNA threonylcarbamoyladenosine biosynthesis protein TsaB
MRLLIDAASEYRIVCLFDNETLVDQMVEQGNNDHSKYLLPQIDRLLSRHQLKPCELEAIIVGQGPGSYTGVRIAVTIAKSFAVQCRIPLFSVDSLSLFATQATGMVAVQIPMKRNIILGAVYDVQGSIEVVQPAGYYSEAEWQKLTGMSVLLEPHQVSINLQKLSLDLVDDVMRFAPNYAREWQPT